MAKRESYHRKMNATTSYYESENQYLCANKKLKQEENSTYASRKFDHHHTRYYTSSFLEKKAEKEEGL